MNIYRPSSPVENSALAGIVTPYCSRASLIVSSSAELSLSSCLSAKSLNQYVKPLKSTQMDNSLLLTQLLQKQT